MSQVNFVGGKGIISSSGRMQVDVISGGGGGQQYPASSTGMGATGTGTLVIGVQSGATTGRALALSVTGGLHIASMPAVGGGQQYSVANTDMGATATGGVLLGIQATTARAIELTVSGGIANVATIGTLLGTVAVSGGGGGVQYPINDTSMAATGTGTLVLGLQSGATTSRGIAVTVTGAQHVSIIGTAAVTAANVTIASITTGTVSIINTPTFTVSTLLATPVIVVTASANPLIVSTVSTVLTMPVIVVTASANPLIVSTVSTVLTMPVLSAANVTIASITTGTVNVINVLSATGLLLAATTAKVGAFVWTAHASNWQAAVIATTSAAAGIIVKTSGAHTLYITDWLINVAGPMTATLCSETTALAYLVLATNGGAVMNMVTPLVCTSAQSLRIVCGSSGSCNVMAAGYSVT